MLVRRELEQGGWIKHSSPLEYFLKKKEEVESGLKEINQALKEHKYTAAAAVLIGAIALTVLLSNYASGCN